MQELTIHLLKSFVLVITFRYDRQATCCKNPEKRVCLDLILTNCARRFQNSSTIQTGLSDFHKFVVAVMKITYKKSQPKIIIHRSYKYFNNESFRKELLQLEANGNNCNESLTNFTSSCNVILNKHAPSPLPQERNNVKENNGRPFL